MRKIIKFILIFAILFTNPLLNLCFIEKQQNRTVKYSAITPTQGFIQRKRTYLEGCKTSDSNSAQSARAYLGLSVNEETIEKSLNKINSYRDTSDFDMNYHLRLMYFDRDTQVLSLELKNQIKNTILGFKYWFTEPNEDKMIMWTENHMILFHTAELLAGQLYPNEIFNNSGMTGIDHINHALPLINRWLDWRVKYGFAEFHSNIYFKYDLTALLNLVDFSEDETIVTKAAMLIDIMAFDFANNYFRGIYATTHGRTKDENKMGTSLEAPASRDSTSEPAWIILGIGYHNPDDKGNSAAYALSTSERYIPPPILEDIASDAKLYNEHKERNSIDLKEGPNYGFGYSSEDDLMFWLPMSAPFAPPLIDAIIELKETYNLDPWALFHEELFFDIVNLFSSLRGLSISEFCELWNVVTLGACLETANCYTYRTPYYQLSGAQDHKKGMNNVQDHIWQASLDEGAVVFTSSPGGVSDQVFTGGWRPRATLYKNIGVIQYDRESLPLDLEILFILIGMVMTGYRPYNHAYFPRWAFDDVQTHGKWTFGMKSNGYIALYSQEPTWWESDYEIRSNGKKNVWIVELGSIEEYQSFDHFISAILQTQIEILPLALGYEIRYLSPSQGMVSVSWNDPLYVGGQEIDLGPYPTFDNDYCYQEFNTDKVTIEYETQVLELDFDTATRTYIN
jgi:hypothetical protein